MINNPLGLTATHLRDQSGTLLHIPYRIAAQGFMLFSPLADIALITVPIPAIEDPTFLAWIGQRGIYKIEDTHSVMARIGEGKVIDRLRRHRKTPLLIAGRVSAAFGLSQEWSYSTRRYLEARLAGAWSAEGHILATHVFNWKILDDNPALKHQLDLQHGSLQMLLAIADRVLDNDADEFCETVPDRGTKWPRPPIAIGMAMPEIDTDALAGEVRITQSRYASHAKVFPHGCRLRFEDGRVCALASVRRDVVLLHPGSRVYLTPGPQAGRNFRKRHASFLKAAKVIGEDDGEIGTTQVTIVADSAAFLIKNVSGGRVHVAHRWQII